MMNFKVAAFLAVLSVLPFQVAQAQSAYYRCANGTYVTQVNGAQPSDFSCSDGSTPVSSTSYPWKGSCGHNNYFFTGIYTSNITAPNATDLTDYWMNHFPVCSYSTDLNVDTTRTIVANVTLDTFSDFTCPQNSAFTNLNTTSGSAVCVEVISIQSSQSILIHSDYSADCRRGFFSVFNAKTQSCYWNANAEPVGDWTEATESSTSNSITFSCPDGEAAFHVNVSSGINGTTYPLQRFLYFSGLFNASTLLYCSKVNLDPNYQLTASNHDGMNNTDISFECDNGFLTSITQSLSANGAPAYSYTCATPVQFAFGGNGNNGGNNGNNGGNNGNNGGNNGNNGGNNSGNNSGNNGSNGNNGNKGNNNGGSGYGYGLRKAKYVDLSGTSSIKLSPYVTLAIGTIFAMMNAI